MCGLIMRGYCISMISSGPFTLNVSVQPRPPVLGCLMQVCDCEYYDFDVRRFVDEAIGKSLHLTTADRAAQRVPRERKIIDTSDGRPSLITKLVPQSNTMRIVVLDCTIKFLTSWKQESRLQIFFPRSAKTSSASIAPSSPAR